MEAEWSLTILYYSYIKLNSVSENILGEKRAV